MIRTPVLAERGERPDSGQRTREIGRKKNRTATSEIGASDLMFSLSALRGGDIPSCSSASFVTREIARYPVTTPRLVSLLTLPALSVKSLLISIRTYMPHTHSGASRPVAQQLPCAINTLRFTAEERPVSRWKRLMLFQFAFLLPTYPSATAIIPLVVVVVVVVWTRSCRLPCQWTPPSRERGKAGSFQPFEDVKTQSLSVARESESKSTSHTRSLAGIINTPICLHSSSYKVSQTLSSSVHPCDGPRALDSFGRRSIPPRQKDGPDAPCVNKRQKKKKKEEKKKK